MQLARTDHAATALGLGPRELVSLTGGGGKTTLMFELGGQLDGKVVLTTTTKMSAERTDGFPTIDSPTPEQLAGRIEAEPKLLVWGGREATKVVGFDPAVVDSWFDLVDHVVVEADGSRQRPFKAPAPHEPPIPSRTTTAISVIGADALGRVIADQCHRPLRVAAVAGCSPYERLTPAAAAAVIDSDRAGRRNVPAGARFIVAITRVDQQAQRLAAQLSDELAARGIPAVAFVAK